MRPPLVRIPEDLILCAWLGLCLASFIISLVSFRRRGLIGFSFGLLSLLGAALSFLCCFGLPVAFEDPGGLFQKGSMMLNGVGLTGLGLFTLGARLGLHRKPTH